MTTLGCGDKTSPKTDPQEQLTIAAASNLTMVIDELTGQFRASSGIQAVVSLGSTASLAHQIENGAPFDIFLSADTNHIDRLVGQGLISVATRCIYARGKLVTWTASDSIKTLGDLVSPSVKVIAVPKPEIAPYGRAAVEALKALNLWRSLESKIVYAQNAAMSKQFVQSGNADVAFTASSLTRLLNIGSPVALSVAENLHRPINQTLGVITVSPRKNTAKKFTSFLLSKEAQSLLVERGYRPAPP